MFKKKALLIAAIAIIVGNLTANALVATPPCKGVHGIDSNNARTTTVTCTCGEPFQLNGQYVFSVEIPMDWTQGAPTQDQMNAACQARYPTESLISSGWKLWGDVSPIMPPPLINIINKLGDYLDEN